MTKEDQKNTVDTVTGKAEKASWKRKQKNVEKLIAEITPIEENILQSMTEKNKLIDRITVIRTQMIQECIHPHDELVAVNDDTILCKFCNKKLGIVRRTS